MRTVGDDALLMLCLADGHGGAAAAQHCNTFALSHLRSEVAIHGSSGEALRAACTRVFARLHGEVIAACGTSGTTLTIVIINELRGEMTCANVGDSSALLVTADGHKFLSTDHRLEVCLEERERVKAQGGLLAQRYVASGERRGPVRAWPGGIAVARTIGDADCRQVVSAEPALSTVPIPQYGVVVLCSDGCWDALLPEKVAKIVSKVAERVTTTEAAERVVAKAIKARGLRDDTTCVVAVVGDTTRRSQADPQADPQAEICRRMSAPACFASPRPPAVRTV
jgi:serine/threonine protein phosphatase PrpC